MLDTSNITIPKHPNFEKLHINYDIPPQPEFIAINIEFGKANIKYIFKGISSASVLNFFS